VTTKIQYLVGFRTDIWTRGLPNTKQECLPLERVALLFITIFTGPPLDPIVGHLIQYVTLRRHMSVFFQNSVFIEYVFSCRGMDMYENSKYPIHI
jgi:hypothetical protein